MDETEALEVKHFPFASMGEMIRNKEITQLFTVTAYHLAKDIIRNGEMKVEKEI
ncbi:hypothetical protein [Sporosarcina sp. UB5]|uniref:hypothetical protein n=1 Tax=Sporosarcina sp. UB5 TaxID=3047463 RepID=UPI003D79E9B2